MPAARTCRICGGLLDDGAPNDVCQGCILADLIGASGDHAEGPREPSQAVISPALDSGATTTLDDAPADTGPRPTRAQYKVLELLGEGGCESVSITEQESPVRFGDYELLEIIARGGMGVVFKARQISLNRTVALKMILAGHLALPGEVQRFRAEAESAARLDHPNIVPIYEVGENGGRHFYTMKLIEGGSLSARLDEFALPPPDSGSSRTALARTHSGLRQRQARIAALVATVARAVHYAHQRGIIHRDLKPANILIDPTGTPHVTDLGIAKRLGEDAGMTRPGAVVGTPAYMSPEQAAGGATVTTVSDVYSVGAILYELLCGRPPFAAEDLLSLLRRIRDDEPADPRLVNPAVDHDLATVCAKCLQKDPGSRYGSALAMAEDLERWVRHEPIAARPARWHERTRKWVARHPATAALLLAIALVTAGGFATVTWQWRRAERALGVAEWNNYGALIALANVEWQARSLSRGDEFLGQCKPALRHWEWNYLKGQCHPHLLRLTAQAAGPEDVAFSPDGLTVATASADGTVILWDIMTGGEVVRLEHGRTVCVVTFSPTGRRIATFAPTNLGESEPAGDLTIWDIPARSKLRSRVAIAPLTMTGLESARPRLTFSPDGRCLLCKVDRERYAVWQVATGKDVLTLTAPTDRPPAFSRDGRRVRTDRGIFEIDSGALVASDPAEAAFEAAQDPNRDRSFGDPGQGRRRRLRVRSTDGSRTAEVDRGNLTIEEGTSPKVVLHTRRIGDRPFYYSLNAATFSDDGLRLATAGWYGPPDGAAAPTVVLDVWDGSIGRDAWSFEANDLPVSGLSFSPSGRYVAVANGAFEGHMGDNANAPGRTRVWDLAMGRCVLSWGVDYDPPQSVAVSRDGTRVAVAGFRGAAVVFDATTGKRLLVLRGHDGPVRDVAFSPDGASVATSGRDGVRVWDARSGTQVLSVDEEKGVPKVVAYTPDGALLAVAMAMVERRRFGEKRGFGEGLHRSDGEARLWNAKTGQLVRTVPDGWKTFAPGDFYEGVRSPDHTRIAGPGRHGTVRLRDAADETNVVELKGHRFDVMAAAWFPGGDRVVTASDDGTAKVWDTATGQALLTLYDEERAGHYAEWSPVEDRLAVACWDNAVRIWSPNSSDETVLRGHVDTVNAVRWSPDGRRIASASDDGTVRVWGVAGARELYQATGHAGGAASVAWRPDGACIASSDDRSFIYVWSADSGRQLRRFGAGPFPSTPSRTRALRELAWNTTGQYVAARSKYQVNVWDPSAKWVARARADALCWSPDGQSIVDHDATGFCLRHIRSKRLIPMLPGAAWYIGSPAFSPDGRRIAIAGNDNSLILCDTATGRQLLTLRGFTDRVTHANFSRDGKMLAAAANDGSVRVYDATPLDERRQRKPPAAGIPVGE